MIGVLEYQDSVFIKDVMQKVGKPYQWITYKQLPAPFYNDFRVILDRVGFQNEFLNTALKIQSMNGVYVINNPFSCDALNKGVDMALMDRLKIPHPKTFVMPSNEEDYDMTDIIGDVDWGIIEYEVKFPAIFKPILGWGWSDVCVVNSLDELKQRYQEFVDKQVMILQEKINADKFLRVFCIGKEKTKIMKYLPAPLGAGKIVENDCSPELSKKVEEWSLKFNKAVDLDFNVVEWAVCGEQAYVIDAFNPIPDVSQTIPKDYYNWIVDELAAFIKDAYTYSWKNKQPF